LLELTRENHEADNTVAAGERYLPIRKVRERYDTSDTSIDRWLQDETTGFPKPVYLSKRRYWKLSDLLRWEARQAELTAATAMNSIVPASNAPKPVKTRRLSKRLRQAIVLWLTGKAGTRKDAASKAKLSEAYFCKALKRPAAQSFVREWAEQNVSEATLRASALLTDLLDPNRSAHVAARTALRLLESEKLISPAGVPGVAVQINNGVRAGYRICWKSRERPLSGPDAPAIDATPESEDAP
jgi:predicted DNA-binding transcriptional regulator AlpA